MTPTGASNGAIEFIRSLIEWAALGIEVLAVAVIAIAVIVVAVTGGPIRYLFDMGKQGAYENYKHQLGKALLLGLELLVAADVVRTVALEPTLNNVAVLALLVVVRTFLSWSLVVEIEGRWPWRSGKGRGEERVEGRGSSDG